MVLTNESVALQRQTNTINPEAQASAKQALFASNVFENIAPVRR